MRSNPETGEMEVFHSAALSDDLPEEDEVRFSLCVYLPLLLANAPRLALVYTFTHIRWLSCYHVQDEQQLAEEMGEFLDDLGTSSSDDE
jgi:hypothetical protein